MSEELPNLDFLKSQTLGNEAITNAIINVMKEAFEIDKFKYKEAIINNNLQDASSIVHKLHHSINLLGLKKGAKLAKQHESLLLNNDKSLVKNFDILLDNISNFIKTL